MRRLLCWLGLHRKAVATDRHAGWTIDQKVREILSTLGRTVRLARCWLWIDENESGGFDLWLMSGRDSHDPHRGSGYSVTVRNGEFTHFAKTVLSLWPVSDGAERERLEIAFRAAIDEALGKVPEAKAAA